MSYDKDLAKKRNKKQIEQFKLGERTTLFIPEISKIPGKVYSNSLDIYTKREIQTSATEAIHVIKKNGKLNTLTYHAKQESLKQLKKFGLIPTETPLSQAISKLGEYRQIILRRAYESHKLTSLNTEKMALLDFSQDLLQVLEPLECLTNTLDVHQHEQQKIKIQIKIDSVMNELEKYRSLHYGTLTPLIAFDKNALHKMDSLYRSLQKNLETLSEKIEKASLADLKILLKPTGPNAIHTLAKNMGMAILAKTEEFNQNLVYSRRAKSFFRGKLHDACENALQAIQSYEADPLNPLLVEHQGNFDSFTDTMVIDFQALNELNAKDFIYAINEISGHGIQYVDGEYLLNGVPLASFAPPKKKIAWKNFLNWITHSAIPFLGGLMLGALSLLVSVVIDLPIAFFIALFTFDYIKAFSVSTLLFPQKKKNPSSSIPLVDELSDCLSFETPSFGTTTGRKIALLGINLLKDIGQTLVDMSHKLIWGFYDIALDTKVKFRKGNRTEQCKTVLTDINTSLSALQKQKISLLSAFEEHESKMVEKKLDDSSDASFISITSTKTANAPYHLSTGEWADIFNILSDKLKTSLDEGITYLLAKDPFKTNVMLLIQLGALMTIMTPAALPLVTQIYTQIYSFLQNTLSAIVPQSIISLMNQIISNGSVQYVQLVEMLENLININQPLGIDSTDTKTYEEPLGREHDCDNKLLLNQSVSLQREAFLLLLVNQEVLHYLSNKKKRSFMMVIEELFKDTKNKGALIKGISGLLYPSVKKTPLNRTATLIIDYIPLLARCLLSPITFSTKPWYELSQKILKDVTRIFHAVSRLCNALFNLVVRLFIRAPGDILVNEIGARAQGKICNNKHTISKVSYQVGQHFNTTTENIRQTASVGIDFLRRKAGTPAPPVAFKSAKASLHVHGFFAPGSESRLINREANSPTISI